ncbi:hypothetical protein D9M70_610120 [compost metagenome]
MFEGLKFVAVVAIEPFARAYPKEAVRTFFDTHNRVKGKAVAHVQLTERKILRPQLPEQSQK